MKRIFLALLLPVVGMSSVLAARSAPDTVTEFYKYRIESGGRGIPSGHELATLSSYLGPELVCLLGTSLRYSERYAHDLPDSPLPFADMDLYTSSAQGPNQFTLGQAELGGSEGQIHVRFTRESETSSPQNWEDVVKVSITHKRWLIDDVVYSSNTTGEKHGSLAASLRETLSHPAAGTHWDVRELSSCNLDPVPVKTNAHGKHGKARGKHAVKGKKGSAHGKVGAKTTGKASHGKAKSGQHAAAKTSHKRHGH